jgi:hypothetical protein
MRSIRGIPLPLEVGDLFPGGIVLVLEVQLADCAVALRIGTVCGVGVCETCGRRRNGQGSGNEI